jgi:hypothetical protein
MRYRQLLIMFLLYISSLLLIEPVTAQKSCKHPDTRAWIRVEDANHNYDTLWFGFATTGTCGVDFQLCEISLVEPCGPVNDFFCVWWYVGFQCAPENQGTLVRNNYYGYHTPTQIDTFEIQYNPGPPDPRYPVKISWSRQLVSALYDSSVIQDLFGGIVYRIRMDQQDSIIIKSSMGQLIIIGKNPILTSVPLPPVVEPTTFVLQQNYPNPFNPSTTISYQLPTKVYAALKVFDVLGREVAILVNKIEEQGYKSVSFDANELPSGVYYYRLRAGNYIETKKLLLLR